MATTVPLIKGRPDLPVGVGGSETLREVLVERFNNPVGEVEPIQREFLGRVATYLEEELPPRVTAPTPKMTSNGIVQTLKRYNGQAQYLSETLGQSLAATGMDKTYLGETLDEYHNQASISKEATWYKKAE